MGPIAGIAGFEGGKDAPPGRAIIEIGPYDLPPPEGGYVDLVLDEEPSAPAAGAVGGAPTRVPSRSIPVPEAPPPGPGDGGAPRTLPREAGPAPARARAPLILVPETLLVGGFLLLGATFAAAVHLARTS
ncbi:MAG TPA: hypothetical protein VIW03_05875, partial [Anaeromyxobacter sp.]